MNEDVIAAGERERVRHSVFARLADLDLAAAVSALVATPSPNPPGHESDVARMLTSLVQRWGLVAEADPVAEGRDNVRVSIRPRDDDEDKGRGLDVLFVGHLDTVPADPANWTVDPFGGTVADGAVWGRGSVDMKGGLAAMAAALSAVAAVAPERARRVDLLAVVGEEVDCRGSRAAVAAGNLPPVGMLVVGEPTDLRVVIAHKGALRLEIAVRGRAAHGARPELGANAVTAAARVIAACDAATLPTGASHPLLGPATMSINTVEGGSAINVVPDSCRVTLDIRTLPGDDHVAIRQAVEDTVQRTLQRVPGVSARVGVLNEVDAVSTDLDDPAVAAARRAARHAWESDPGEPNDAPFSPVGVAFFSDASVLQPALAAPTVLFGPGATTLMHQDDEHVRIDDLYRAARFYAALILGTDPPTAPTG